MAENQTAEDDDEEGFGEFAFASPAAVPSKNLKINGGGPDLSFDNLKIYRGGHEDDDGGDFVTFPTVSLSQSTKDAKQKPGSELNVGDLVSDLLKQSQQSKGSNGLNLDSNGSNFSLNGLNSVSDGDFRWEFKGSGPKLAAGDFNFKVGNHPVSDFSVFNSSWNVLGSDLNGLSSRPSRVNLDTEFEL